MKNREDFAIAMGYKSTSEFENFAKTHAQRVGYLRKVYDINSYKQEDLNKLFVNGINKSNNTKKILTFNSKKFLLLMVMVMIMVSIQNVVGGLVGCLGVAFAGAIVGNAACIAIDWVTLGISAYWCHGGVILLQAAISDGCNLDFKKCHNKKTKDNIAE